MIADSSNKTKDGKTNESQLNYKTGGSAYQPVIPTNSYPEENAQRYARSWVAGELVTVGDKLTYNGRTYDCLQVHITQAGWMPVME